MKHHLLTTIAALLVVGCGESQQSVPHADQKESAPRVKQQSKPLSEADQLFKAAASGNIEALKEHLAAGTDVNTAEPPPQQTIILTLGGFNLAFLETAVVLARHYAVTLTGR